MSDITCDILSDVPYINSQIDYPISDKVLGASRGETGPADVVKDTTSPFRDGDTLLMRTNEPGLTHACRVQS
jgi:hypothetical protein